MWGAPPKGGNPPPPQEFGGGFKWLGRKRGKKHQKSRGEGPGNGGGDPPIKKKNPKNVNFGERPWRVHPKIMQNSPKNPAEPNRHHKDCPKTLRFPKTSSFTKTSGIAPKISSPPKKIPSRTFPKSRQMDPKCGKSPPKQRQRPQILKGFTQNLVVPPPEVSKTVKTPPKSWRIGPEWGKAQKTGRNPPKP